MASILIHLAATLSPWDRHFPGPRPGRRVIERDFVIQSVRIKARKSFDHMQAVGGTPEIRFIGEVCCIHDERIAFPVPARVTEPQTHTCVQMWTPVDGNNAGFVDHFIKNDHLPGTLNDLYIAVVCDAGNSRKALSNTTLP